MHNGRSDRLGPRKSTTKWKLTVEDRTLSSAVVADDGTLYFGSERGMLYAIDPNGAIKWTHEVTHSPNWPIAAEQSLGSPTLGKEGVIYVGTTGGIHQRGHQLVAIDPNGELRWKSDIGTPIRNAPSLSEDGTIYVRTEEELIAFHENGQVLWRFRKEEPFWSPPAIASDGTVYIGCHDGQFYALDPNGG